jgi:hypothetical protein
VDIGKFGAFASATMGSERQTTVAAMLTACVRFLQEPQRPQMRAAWAVGLVEDGDGVTLLETSYL